MDQENVLDKANIPQHIAIIMDGNGRWAKQHGKDRIFGHQNGVKAVRDTVDACVEFGVKYLTLYAFSTENWNRPKVEIDALMSLLVKAIKNEVPELNKNGISLNAIGNLEALPEECQAELKEAIEMTSGNKSLQLNLALSYSSRWEISNAVKNISQAVKEGSLNVDSISEELISDYLTTKSIPDPELMIRTSGELRISNYLLWQIAYSELYFTDILWPDFNRNELLIAILDYQARERRFGKTSEQIKI